MTGIFLFFAIMLFFMLFLPALLYMLPVLLIIWLVSALVNSFRRPRMQTRTYYYNFDPNAASGRQDRTQQIPKRSARPDSIDAEFTEVEIDDEPRDPE